MKLRLLAAATWLTAVLALVAFSTGCGKKAGGTLIHAQDFESYAPTFEAILQKRPTGAPKVEIKVEGDAIRGFVWTQDEGDLITFGVEGGKINVPENTPAIWYLSPTSVGTMGEPIVGLAAKVAQTMAKVA